jgi:hypothetical protein
MVVFCGVVVNWGTVVFEQRKVEFRRENWYMGYTAYGAVMKHDKRKIALEQFVVLRDGQAIIFEIGLFFEVVDLVA